MDITGNIKQPVSTIPQKGSRGAIDTHFEKEILQHNTHGKKQSVLIEILDFRMKELLELP